LRAIGRSDPGYRDAAIGRPTLELVLDDPRAPVSARIGAAIALVALDPSMAQRVRATARTAADPDLRDALESVALGRLDADIVHAATRGAPR
ncbi:MAG: hypothetical protein IT379_01350, partial [Deltaproteobacteria bacterium]|nr:hypothetical protein [Deltaproteobacteria bacterium]